MRLLNSRVRHVAFLAALLLVIAACSSGTSDTTAAPDEAPATTADGGTDETTAETEPPATEPPSEEPMGAISTYIGEPEHLSPANTNESEGSAVLDALFTGLIEYDAVSSDPVFTGVAESITSDDGGQTWNVVLNDGWTFHDGSPVTSESFINAWNYAAYGPNAAQVAGFFSNIAGYADLQCGTVTEQDEEGEDVEVADCENQPPASETLSGLTAVDDLNFTIELEVPETFFMTRLGYTAYYPAPQAFFDDPAGFEEAPVGNGPFMIDGVWEHDVRINTVANPNYAGGAPAQIDGLEFRIFADVDTAINELLAGNLDIVDEVTPERADEVAASVSNNGTSPSSSINYLGFPTYDPNWSDPTLRAALSMAIDQEEITTVIFNGTREPAFNLQSPVIPGYEANVCDNWGFDPAAAKELYDSVGGITEPITVWFNEGAGHDDWVQAVVNQWANNLGLDPSLVSFETRQFADYLPILDAQEITGPFRLGWGMDYPHPQNYWQLLLDSRFTPANGGSNNTGYSNSDFDAKIDEANAEADINDAIPLYQEAAAIACEDVPLIPMFYGQNVFAWTDNVDGVYVDAFGRLDYGALTAGG